MSGVYAAMLGVALLLILLFNASPERPGLMHELFFGATGNADDDANDTEGEAVPPNGGLPKSRNDVPTNGGRPRGTVETVPSESSGESIHAADAGARPSTEDAGAQPSTEDAGAQPSTEDAGAQPSTEDAEPHEHVEPHGEDSP